MTLLFAFLVLVAVAFLLAICVEQVRDLRAPKDRPTHWSSPVRPKKPKKMRR